MRRGACAAEMGRAGMAHMSGAGVTAHVRRVSEHRMRVMGGGVVLRHAMVSLMGRLMDRRRTGVLERGSVMVSVICMLGLALLARMRVLWRVIDIVVRSYTVVARQRASGA